jgi:hypothetical protein
MLQLYLRNPDDGIVSYNQIRVYRSDSKTGTYVLITTVDVDQTTITDNSPGYSVYKDPTGTSSNWYKVSYYNSSSSTESDTSDAFQGETTELDAKIRRRVKDENENKYFFDNDEIAQARDIAIKSLYPATWIDTEYDVVITDLNKKLISLPSYVARVDEILVYDATANFIGSYNAFYQVGNKIRPLNEFPVGFTFRFTIVKPYKVPAEVPEELDNYLLDVAQIELLKSMEMDRARYYKYTTSIRPEGGNMPSLGRIIDRLEVNANRKLNPYRRVRSSSEINLTG